MNILVTSRRAATRLPTLSSNGPPARCVITLTGWAAALAALAFAASPASARGSPPPASVDGDWRAVVAYVIDGDTGGVRPEAGGRPVSLRIEGIDAPEICQVGGPASREALRGLVLGRAVVVHGARRDNYGRLLATVDVQGRDVGRLMVVGGWAWSYRYRRDVGPYYPQERQARAARLGLFAQVGVIEPRQFRKEHGSCHPR